MNRYWESVKVLVIRLLWVMVFYQIARIVFYGSNHFVFQSAGFMEFIGGLRFDLSAIFYVNAILIIGHTIPGNFKYNKSYQLVLKILFFAINLIFLATNFIDVEYFKFTSRRSTFALITASGMEGDILRLIPVFLKSYWWLFLGFVVLALLFWKFIPDFKAKKNETPSHSTKSKKAIPYLIFIFSLGLILIFGRGGFQRNPLKIVDAIRYTHNSVNTPLVLNTPFSILKTLSKKSNLKEVHFFDEEELNEIYQPIIYFDNQNEFQKKNIVLIILESFGEENLFLEFDGKPLTPFIDSLTQSSLYFDNGFANGRKSIDAVPSTILSIPCLMDVSYISSPFSFNKVEGFNKVLKDQGYRTAFYHGSFNGSQNFYQFSSIASFDEYYGKNEYDRIGGEDGVWGIFDEEFLQFSVRKMDTEKQPFFSTIFTISSHNPYIIPEKHKGKFSKGDRIIHETISYSDFALKKFFESAKKSDWYENTVFIITADHTSGDDKRDLYYLNPIGMYKVPIMILDPSHPEIHRKDSKLMEQIDILPEILDYLNFSGEVFSYGNPPKKENGRLVANYSEGLYHFIIDNYYVCFDGKEIIKVNDIKKDKLLEKNLKEYPKALFEKLIKAYIQQYNNRIIQNKTNRSSIEKGTHHTK
ncbi:MAG: sulfatase-like hydrolase/transferase [Weeksellaceae bacterium]